MVLRDWSALYETAETALGMPLRPSPCRWPGPCAVYAWQPGGGEGAAREIFWTVRVYAESESAVRAALARLAAAIVSDGQSGEGMTVRARREGGDFSFSRALGMAFGQAGFAVRCSRGEWK